MRILILSKIDPGAVERLRLEHDVVEAIGVPASELPPLLADREILVFRSGVDLTAELLASAPDLSLLVRAGSGFDNLDIDYVREHRIEFVRIPGPGARAVAELTFGLMLVLARDIIRADAAWRKGRWLKNELQGTLLRGKVLGVVGAGSIGSEVGELGALWGMHVIGCVGNPTPEIERRLARRGIRLADFDEVVRSADFLSVHVRLTEETRNLIDADVLASMKPGAFLLNLARGGVVDEHAVREALTRPGGLRGAALDVHAAEGDGRISPLADLPNVVLTPHIGATTLETQREIGERVVAAISAHALRRAQPTGVET